ncbi:hypothetical protein Poli38472_001390 [Pythium oligandrum]|uniref:Uncharacterized protein n=1 Tax=Pythium oligandrum TaxID=41045 RepID=A0A8K1CTE7_PYTOL|nr:hypothetical protein Poli38472_001390 [Pythium oligandrum]|eukprot:TMW69234.1 hypothetical protein Poli38472_001390 [Pythium oligandrum]
MAKKVLNLSRKQEDSSSAASSSSGSEDEREQQPQHEDRDDSGSENSESDEEDEYEIPPGFESVSGPSTITRESVLDDKKELWFFKLPKNVDASTLANLTFKVDAQTGAAAGKVITSVKHDGKSYQLQTEDALLTNQLVNAFPSANDRKKYTLAKPFARCFSLIEERAELKKRPATESAAAEPAQDTPSKKHKSKSKSKSSVESTKSKKSKNKH